MYHLDQEEYLVRLFFIFFFWASTFNTSLHLSDISPLFKGTYCSLHPSVCVKCVQISSHIVNVRL